MKVNGYFSIKDPDFNDLARVAIQAVENGVLAAVVINDGDHSDKIGETLYLGLNMTAHGIANEINAIKSLYPKTHNLKIKPCFLDAIKRGEKTFEIRFDDRGFKVGDKLLLMAFDGENYTGDELLVHISYVLDNWSPGLRDGYVALGIKAH